MIGLYPHLTGIPYNQNYKEETKIQTKFKLMIAFAIIFISFIAQFLTNSWISAFGLIIGILILAKALLDKQALQGGN